MYGTAPQGLEFLHSELQWFSPKQVSCVAQHQRSSVASVAELLYTQGMDWPSIETWILSQAQCASSTVSFFLQQITQPGSNPMDVQAAVLQYALTLYKIGKCVGS